MHSAWFDDDPSTPGRILWRLDRCSHHVATQALTGRLSSPPLPEDDDDDDDVLFLGEVLPPSSSGRRPRLQDLPEELLHHLLRYYIPARDKIRTLSRLPVFRPHLRAPGVLSPGVRELGSLEELLAPGWYRIPWNPDLMLHWEVHYDTLAGYVDVHRLHPVFGHFYVETHDGSVTYPDLRRGFERLAARRSLIPAPDFLNYYFRHPVRERFATLWLFPESGRVRWSWSEETFRLDDRQSCVLDDDHGGTLALRLLRDRTTLRIWIPGKGNGIRAVPLRYGACVNTTPEARCRCDWSCDSQWRVEWMPEEGGRIRVDSVDKDDFLGACVPELMEACNTDKDDRRWRLIY